MWRSRVIGAADDLVDEVESAQLAAFFEHDIRGFGGELHERQEATEVRGSQVPVEIGPAPPARHPGDDRYVLDVAHQQGLGASGLGAHRADQGSKHLHGLLAEVGGEAQAEGAAGHLRFAPAAVATAPKLLPIMEVTPGKTMVGPR